MNQNIGLAANHRNIQFSTVEQHKARHAAAGGFRTPISNQPMIDRTMNGRLPDLATPYAKGWADRARDVGLMGVSGLAIGLEALDYADPFFGPIGVFTPTPMGCGTLDC